MPMWITSVTWPAAYSASHAATSVRHAREGGVRGARGVGRGRAIAGRRQRRAQGRVQRRALLGGIDGVAAQQRRHGRAVIAGARQVVQRGQRREVDPLAREVDPQGSQAPRQALQAPGLIQQSGRCHGREARGVFGQRGPGPRARIDRAHARTRRARVGVARALPVRANRGHGLALHGVIGARLWYVAAAASHQPANRGQKKPSPNPARVESE